MKPSTSPANLPAPARHLIGLALLAGSVGFTGVLSFVHILLELFD